MSSTRKYVVALVVVFLAIVALAYGIGYNDAQEAPQPTRIGNMVVQEDGTLLEEDEPGWDCATMGNMQCGSDYDHEAAENAMDEWAQKGHK